MNTLDAAFQNIYLIFIIYGIFILMYGLLAKPGCRGKSMAIAVIDHGSLIGLAAILSMPLISPFHVDIIQVLTGVFVEVFCAAVFFMSSIQIINFLRAGSKIIPGQYVWMMIFCKLFFFVANYMASDGQYGIFSDDSRLDFIKISPIISRTWYLDMIIDFIIFLNISLKCLVQKKIKAADLISTISIIGISFLTGSKGASFLMITYAMLFVYAAFPRIVSKISTSILVFYALILSGIIFIYIYFLSESLGVSVGDQIRLTLSRFLLSADARIMAFDPNVNEFILSQPHGVFLSELFRGPARILGLLTAEFPIGVYQYQYQAGTTNYVGSTNQLSAMFIIYGGYFWVAEFFIVSSLVWLTYKFLKYSIHSNKLAVRWVSAASFFLLSDSLCKGFDAFLQLLPICILLIIALIFFPKFRWMSHGVRVPVQSRSPNSLQRIL